MMRSTWPLSFRKSTVVASIRVRGGQSFLRGFCQRISLTLNLVLKAMDGGRDASTAVDESITGEGVHRHDGRVA